MAPSALVEATRGERTAGADRLAGVIVGRRPDVALGDDVTPSHVEPMPAFTDRHTAGREARDPGKPVCEVGASRAAVHRNDESRLLAEAFDSGVILAIGIIGEHAAQRLDDFGKVARQRFEVGHQCLAIGFGCVLANPNIDRHFALSEGDDTGLVSPVDARFSFDHHGHARVGRRPRVLAGFPARLAAIAALAHAGHLAANLTSAQTPLLGRKRPITGL